MVGLTGAMTPGPVLSATIAESLKRGFFAGPLIVFGHAILEILLVAAAVAGFGRFLAQPLWQAGLGVLGGIMLLAMAASTIFTARQTAQSAVHGIAGAVQPQNAWRGSIATGFILSLSNPYWLMWWVTIGLFYISQAMERKMLGLLVFYAGHIGADFAWYSLVSCAVASGRRIFPASAYRWALVLCGAVLGVLGARFALKGIFYFMEAS